MILFCEECGTRHDIDPDQYDGQSIIRFSCKVCNEKLVLDLSKRVGSKSVVSDIEQAQTESDNGYKLKVLIVDDSKLIRKVLSQIITENSKMEIAGEAADGREALDLIHSVRPDVVTLDINMPNMDGLTTLKHIMIQCPTPTVMISSLTREGAKETFDALKYGAIDFLPKPSQANDQDLEQQKEDIIQKIEMAAAVQLESVRYLRPPTQEDHDKTDLGTECNTIVAMGACEGGYGALLNIIPRLEPNLPAAYIAIIHASDKHLDAFVSYLDEISAIKVKRAEDKTPIQGGNCYLASSAQYVTVEKDAERYLMNVNPSPFPTRRGAINILMISLSELMLDKAVGVVLTGAGQDGVEGIGEIIRLKGTALVQDPRTCLFKDMASAAIERYKDDVRLVSDKQVAEVINMLADATS